MPALAIALGRGIDGRFNESFPDFALARKCERTLLHLREKWQEKQATLRGATGILRNNVLNFEEKSVVLQLRSIGAPEREILSPARSLPTPVRPQLAFHAHNAEFHTVRKAGNVLNVAQHDYSVARNTRRILITNRYCN